MFFCPHTTHVPQPFLQTLNAIVFACPWQSQSSPPTLYAVTLTELLSTHGLHCRMELDSHDLSPKPSSLVEEHHVLCDCCNGIVTNNISKYNAIKASVTAPPWQASYFPPQSELNNNKTLLNNLYRQREAYNSKISCIWIVLDLLKTNRWHINRVQLTSFCPHPPTARRHPNAHFLSCTLSCTHFWTCFVERVPLCL